MNYLFPNTEPKPRGRLDDLPLASGKTLQPINKTENEVKDKSTSPSADKEFFSFFNLSSFDIPVGAQKGAIDLEDNTEK